MGTVRVSGRRRVPFAAHQDDRPHLALPPDFWVVGGVVRPAVVGGVVITVLGVTVGVVVGVAAWLVAVIRPVIAWAGGLGTWRWPARTPW